LLGFATPVVLALVATTPSAPAEEAEGALCRLASPPSLDLYHSCASGVSNDCWSTYWWGVTVDLLPSEARSRRDAAEPSTVTLRAGSGSWAEARALEASFLEGLVPCSFDSATGEVQVREGNNATVFEHGPQPPGRREERPPRPLGVLLAAAVWESALEAVGAAPRPPPDWLLRFGLLRLEAPLITLSVATLLVARLESRRSHSALLVPAMLAAYSESATELVLAAYAAAAERRRAGDSLAPVALALVFVALGGGAVCAVLLEPLLKEVRRCGAALEELRQLDCDAHPLGPLLSAERRPVTRSLSRLHAEAAEKAGMEAAS